MNHQATKPFLCVFLFLCWVFSGLLTAQDSSDEIPHDYISPLDQAARILAENGRDHEALELVTVMETLAYPADEVKAVRAYCYRMLAMKKKAAPRVTAAAQKIRLSARRWPASCEN